jgi:hypothetical protein
VVSKRTKGKTPPTTTKATTHPRTTSWYPLDLFTGVRGRMVHELRVL